MKRSLVISLAATVVIAIVVFAATLGAPAETRKRWFGRTAPAAGGPGGKVTDAFERGQSASDLRSCGISVDAWTSPEIARTVF